MKTRQPHDGHAPQQVMHPAFKSGATVAILVAQLDDKRADVNAHGEKAVSCRQEAEERLRSAKNRQLQLADLEQKVAQVRAEAEHYEQAGRDCNTAADNHSAAQADAELIVRDIEDVLRLYAPAALDPPTTPPGVTQVDAYPPQPGPLNGAVPLDGPAPGGQGGHHETRVAGGTGPLPMPKQGRR